MVRAIIIKAITAFNLCCPMNVIGAPLITPCNLANAITEPEKVIAPIEVPRDSSIKEALPIFPKLPIPKTSGLKKADTATNTVVAKRAFVAGQPIEFQGTQVALSDIPKSGDSFTVEANTDGFGSNENILRLIALGKQPIISGQTFSEAYLDLVGGAGSRSRMAQLNKEAMEVVRDQAQQSRESKVGVNLDEEATDLIRFQQAYQAAAQVIQVSQKIFDTLLRAG